MRQIRLTSLANADYLQALSWHEKRQTGLGREFEAELEALFKRISQSPEIFFQETPTIRKVRMPRFKYAIYFEAETDEIKVLAIYHPARDPDALRRRFI